MRQAGLTRGSHVAMLIENHPAFLEIAWAAHNAGLYFTPISWRFQLEEIAFILQDCGAQVLFASAQQHHMLHELRRRVPGLRCFLIGDVAEGCENYETASLRVPWSRWPTVTRSDMVYSSGSTGRPGRQAELAAAGSTVRRDVRVYRQRVWLGHRGT
jgi:acyl-CoA synthetase (AMP-forming)/AMP-acid ligase II